MKCPTCGKPVERKDNPFRPFCSERCKMVDLGRWVNDEYRVAGKPIPSESDDAPHAPNDATEDR
ncbi:MAG: DNA gyrase inhibitor YacG [Pyrinomonadaceae bacterium]|nr:DNA gyrase inhibitor YacG [Pyrinomonadaceae bacterium]